jgi:integration host factor subunit alpha
MPTITRAVLADSLYKEVGISQTEASTIVDFIFDHIVFTLAKEEEVKITAFGSFYPRKKKQRIGRNPRTKKEAIIAERMVVSFYASNILKERINKK